MRNPSAPKKASEHAINTSTAFMARRPVFAPVERVRRSVAKGGPEWHVVGDGYEIRVLNDVLTERDCDLIEWLIAHGEPTRIQGAQVACKFSLYRAAKALRQSRGRIIDRVRRLQRTLLSMRDGNWLLEATILGPTLRNTRSGLYLVTMTPQFVRMLGHGVRVYYHDLVDDIIAISSPVVRRLVRRTLSHERRDKGERLTTIFEDMRLTAGVRSADDVRRITERAVQNVLDASDYLCALFGIEVRTEGGEPRVYYIRDRGDQRIWTDDRAWKAQIQPKPADVSDSAVL